MGEAEAVVIGAGPAGLAAGAELRRAGIPAVVVDRADVVGSSWRGRYDRLRLNTSRLTSKLPGARYGRGTPLFPTRDQMVEYLERYADDNELELRLGVEAQRIDSAEDGGWVVTTSDGDLPAREVIVATGYEHTPAIPDWPGRDRFAGELLHAAEYRNASAFQGKEVLVVGPGCSGMEIAYELAAEGAGPVSLAVRTPPNILMRQSGPMPGDIPAILMMRLPTKLADRLVPRADLTKHGLPLPEEGPVSRLRREQKVPAIVDKEVLDAIKLGRIEIVAGVESLDETGVNLADGKRLEPDAVIAATGYRCGLEGLVGHLDVLDERGVPRVHAGAEAAPGLRFVGYEPRPGQIGRIGREAKRAAAEAARARV